MSSLLYGTLTRKREDAESGKSRSSQPPGVNTYVDALAALVPAEVLAIHSVIISLATTTTDGVTKVTAGPQLAFWFVFLTVIAMVLYLAGLQKRPRGWDWVRMLIPGIAFIGWTLLQPTTAFDGVAPATFDPNSRWSFGLAIAVVLSIVAGALGRMADQAPPPAK